MEINYQQQEIDEIAKELLNRFDSKTILFYGEMGSGKTTLIRSLVKLLGSIDDVSSPTFSLVNEYQTEMGNSIFHFDLYRLKDAEELMNFGFEDYFVGDPWVFIEWPEIGFDQLPNNYNQIEIKRINKNSRSLKLSQKLEINL